MSSDIHTRRQLLLQAESVEVDKTGRVNTPVCGMLLLGWLGQVGKRRTGKHGPAPGENDNSRQKLVMGMAYEIYD